MPKDVLEYVVPGVNVSCLHYAIVGEKTNEQLLRLDEQTVSHCSCLSGSRVSFICHRIISAMELWKFLHLCLDFF